MGLRPWELGRMTPAEFAAETEAFEWRQEQTTLRMGWLAYHIVAPHWNRKKGGRLTIDRILGREKPTSGGFFNRKTKAEKRSMFDKLWQKVQARRNSGGE